MAVLCLLGVLPPWHLAQHGRCWTPLSEALLCLSMKVRRR